MVIVCVVVNGSWSESKLNSTNSSVRSEERISPTPELCSIELKEKAEMCVGVLKCSGAGDPGALAACPFLWKRINAVNGGEKMSHNGWNRCLYVMASLDRDTPTSAIRYHLNGLSEPISHGPPDLITKATLRSRIFQKGPIKHDTSLSSKYL